MNAFHFYGVLLWFTSLIPHFTQVSFFKDNYLFWKLKEILKIPKNFQNNLKYFQKSLKNFEIILFSFEILKILK